MTTSLLYIPPPSLEHAIAVATHMLSIVPMNAMKANLGAKIAQTKRCLRCTKAAIITPHVLTAHHNMCTAPVNAYVAALSLCPSPSPPTCAFVTSLDLET